MLNFIKSLKPILIVINTISNYIFQYTRKYLRFKFVLDAAANLDTLELAKNQRFDVPVVVGGGKGKLNIGDKVGFGWRPAHKVGDGHILLQPRALESEIEIGNGTQLNNNVSIVSMKKITIGKNCLIGDFTSIMDSDFHNINPAERMSGGVTEPVIIEDNVWIGSRVLVLRGTRIGENSVIGAGSIVTSDIPRNSVAAGVPAKVIRTL